MFFIRLSGVTLWPSRWQAEASCFANGSWPCPAKQSPFMVGSCSSTGGHCGSLMLKAPAIGNWLQSWLARMSITLSGIIARWILSSMIKAELAARRFLAKCSYEPLAFAGWSAGGAVGFGLCRVDFIVSKSGTDHSKAPGAYRAVGVSFKPGRPACQAGEFAEINHFLREGCRNQVGDSWPDLADAQRAGGTAASGYGSAFHVESAQS